MGCCLSRSAPHSPYPSASPTAADASARNITTSSPPQSSIYSHTRRPSTPSAPVPAQHQHSRHSHPHPHPQPPSAGPPNAPLIPIPLGRRGHLPPDARWTRARLEQERNDFFDTRVTGRPEVWGVVRMVVELVRQGDIDEAQGVLDASGCTCPTGEVWRGIFDEKGAFYPVPEWVVLEPAGLVQADDREPEDDESKGVDDEDSLEALGKEEKGKGRAVEIDPSTLVKVRARLSDRSSDVVVQVGKDERVAILVRRIREAAAVPPRDKIKIGYLGRILHDNESLSAQGWGEGHVVNAFVFVQS